MNIDLLFVVDLLLACYVTHLEQFMSQISYLLNYSFNTFFFLLFFFFFFLFFSVGEWCCCLQAAWLLDYAVFVHWVAPPEPSSTPPSLPPQSVCRHVRHPTLQHHGGRRGRWRRWGQTGTKGGAGHA